MKKTSSVILLVCLLSMNFYASPVDIEKARAIAKNFYYQKFNQNQGQLEYKTLETKHIYTHMFNDEATFFVFEFKYGGFVCVPADDCLPPVIGYSLINDFGYHNPPDNVLYWYNDISTQISYVRKHNLFPDLSIKKKWDYYYDSPEVSNTKSTYVVEPLLTTLWDQGWPYNINCPTGVGGTALTGCVATAYAQALYYWRFPLTGSGSHCYEHDEYGELCADFGNTNYRWEEMCDDPKTANDAIGELMYHVGVAVDMNYGTQASGAMGYPDVFTEYFNISPECDSLNHEFYTDEDWRNIVIDQLNKQFPVIWVGFNNDTSTGHMWVCDGYQDSSYFHMNWGWGGQSNGYYTLDNIQGYETMQYLAINFYPDTLTWEYPYYASGADTCFSLEGNITDGSGPLKDYLHNTNASWLISPQNQMDSVTNISLFINSCDLGEGDYLNIYDGENNSAPSLAEITGNTFPAEITSTGNMVFIEFSSDNMINGKGFDMSYRSTRPVFCTGQKVLTDSILKFDDGSGKFYYQNGGTCMWILQPEGCDSTLTLYFDYFDTEPEVDFLRIIDPQSQEVLADYSGSYNEPPPPVISQSGAMMLLFSKNSSVRAQGWSAYYGDFTGIDDNKPVTNFQIFPNPTSGDFNVEFSLTKKENITISIFSILGEKICVYKFNELPPGNHNKLIDTHHLISGTYYLLLNTDNNQITRKLIKY